MHKAYYIIPNRIPPIWYSITTYHTGGIFYVAADPTTGLCPMHKHNSIGSSVGKTLHYHTLPYRNRTGTADGNDLWRSHSVGNCKSKRSLTTGGQWKSAENQKIFWKTPQKHLTNAFSRGLSIEGEKEPSTVPWKLNNPRGTTISPARAEPKDTPWPADAASDDG